MENPNPIIFEQNSKISRNTDGDYDESIIDEFSVSEIYDHIRTINDPEHPLTLEQLNVVNPHHISFSPSTVSVDFTPTIPHCSMATLIGLCIKVKLSLVLPRRFHLRVVIREGSHQSEHSINKQLADKERVAAAIENEQLFGVVMQCLVGPPRPGIAL
jgi:metal-sulfur cluster biosynthetic enzyme